jgi:hypothetical protein
MVKFWVWFALIVAAIATVSHCDSSVLGSPFNVHFSFGPDGGERGSGVARTETRQIGEFQSIHVEGAGTLDVEVKSGQTERSLAITSDDNLLSLITTEVKDGVLEISPAVSMSPSTGLRLKVSVPALAGIHLEGANHLNLNIDSPADFDLHLEGAGRVKAAGKVGHLNLHSEGAGSIDAAELVAGSVDVHIEGAGKATVNATESLKATIEGAGVITYSGDPKKVEKNIEGIGRIRKAD